jgi:hypothetical protein
MLAPLQALDGAEAFDATGRYVEVSGRVMSVDGDRVTVDTGRGRLLEGGCRLPGPPLGATASVRCYRTGCFAGGARVVAWSVCVPAGAD